MNPISLADEINEKESSIIIINSSDEIIEHIDITSSNNNISPNNKRIRRPNSFLSEIPDSVYSDAQHRWTKK